MKKTGRFSVMPIAKTGYSFTETGIAAAAPRQSGVYAIYNNTEWIYVGESRDIEARLFEHLRGESDQSARILRRNPTGFGYELCDSTTRVAREAGLIVELSPTCNR